MNKATVGVLAAVGGLVIGLGTGVGTAGEARTETVTRRVTPQACRDVIDDAREVASYAGDGFTSAQNVIEAQSETIQIAAEALTSLAPSDADVARIEGLNATIDDETDAMQATAEDLGDAVDRFNSDAEDCQS